MSQDIQRLSTASRCLQYYSMVKTNFRSLLLFELFASRNKPISLIPEEVREMHFVFLLCH